MKKMERTLWYAVSKGGQGRVFTTKPERHKHFGIWVGESVGCISTLFMIMEADGLTPPNIKWSDDPVPFTLSLGF